jgi:hypothetical protein
MNKLRQWIQYYLGILSLEKAAQKRDIELRQGISMLVDKINLLENGMVAGNRHSELCDRMDKLIEEINLSEIKRLNDIDRIVGMCGELQELSGKLFNMFTSQHVPRRQNAEVYDWEQVQAMELAYMQMNPQKEEI